MDIPSISHKTNTHNFCMMSILIPVSLLLCVFFMSGGLGLNTSSCIEMERQALIDVKANLTVADEFGILDGWGSKEGEMDCCQWIGVSCDSLTGHVIELDLYWGGVGKISPSLQVLTQLQSLDLNFIDFQCNPLPTFLGSFSNLQELLMNSANLCGPIPHQLANLSNLRLLDLGNNYLEGFIPYSFGDLTSLIQLDLSQNQLGGVIPKSFENFSSLETLDLSQNQLGGVVPKTIGNFSSLYRLGLSQNRLNGSLPSFVGCSSLQYMYLADNSLNGSMPDLTRCTSLHWLDLSSNFLSKPISNSVLQFSNLMYLSLSHNSLNGSLPNFMGCPSLTFLNMSGNQFSGNVPNNLGQLSNLRALDFSSNSLEGVISEVHFLNLTQLMYLDLSLNSLAVDLKFHGESPLQLSTIKLRSCKLGPKFPMWIKTQKNIWHLDISNAGISDNMPTWFSGLSSGLYYMNLSSNEIKGILPNMSNIGSRGSEKYDLPGIDLSYNYFEGKVSLLPPKLAALNLSGNRFSGTLSFLCEIEEFLTFLDLSNNSFSGSLPDCWLKFQKTLVVLNLSNNNLSRKIPSSLGLLSSLEAMYLRANAFVGEVPLSLSNCTRLRFLDLWGNKLSGFIPGWIGQALSELYVLDLGSNRFYGMLPSEVCWLHNLQVLDLSNNGLSGNIVGCFDNFTAMARKNFTNDMSKHSYASYVESGYKIDICVADRICFPMSAGKAEYLDNAWVTWKGTDRSFGRSGLQLLKSIDLSRNNLSGKVSPEITSLSELVSLNLSFNRLHGEVPKDIGQMKSLESLDLSRNKLSGHIPSNLSELTFLSYLDRSFNNLSGRIPTGSQLQRFDYTSYTDNPQLCGPPLTPGCGISPVVEKKAIEEDEDDFWRSYYTGMGSGFVVGFLGICGATTVIRRCIYIIFVSLSYIKDWIYVIVAVYVGKLGRKFRRCAL